MRALAVAALAAAIACGGRDDGPAGTVRGRADALSAPAPIYGDALAPGWQDWSWATRNLANASPVASGTASIAVTFGAWQGVYFHNAAGGVATAGLEDLEFQINSGPTFNPALHAYATVAGAAGPSIAINVYCGSGSIPANVWTTCRVPLLALGVPHATIDGVVIQEFAGLTLPTMYFDQMGLAGTSIPVYADALASGWQDWSWAADNLANPTPTAAGTSSISATFQPWQGIYFHDAAGGISTAGLDALELAVNPGSNLNPTIHAYVTVAGVAGPSIAIHPYCGGSFAANRWTPCRVPLSALGAANATIDGIVLQEFDGQVRPNMYFDEVALTGASSATAAPPPTTAPPPATTPPPSGAWIAGYYAAYQAGMYPPASVDFTSLTHLYVAAVKPLADGTLDTMFFIDAVNGPALAKDLASRAHAAGKKAILMVGGDGTRAGFVGATSSANLSAFVQRLVQTKTNLGFDGLDLDWEPICTPAQTAAPCFGADDRPAFAALAQALRSAAAGMLLTAPFGWSLHPDPWYGQVHTSFDHVHLMTYPMAGTWPGWQSWHQSALAGEAPATPSSVSAVANAFAGVGIPKAKIGIGIGFFGTCWRGVTGPRQDIAGASVVASDPDMALSAIRSSYYSASTYAWDPAASMGYLSSAIPIGPKACTFVSYEDDASIQAKGLWVRTNGFGGAGIWTINEGFDPSTGTNPPLSSVKSAFIP